MQSECANIFACFATLQHFAIFTMYFSQISQQIIFCIFFRSLPIHIRVCMYMLLAALSMCVVCVYYINIFIIIVIRTYTYSYICMQLCKCFICKRVSGIRLFILCAATMYAGENDTSVVVGWVSCRSNFLHFILFIFIFIFSAAKLFFCFRFRLVCLPTHTRIYICMYTHPSAIHRRALMFKGKHKHMSHTYSR